MIKRKHSRLLVESILGGDMTRSNRLLAKMIAEAEGDREELAKDEAYAELGILDLEEDLNKTDIENDSDDTDSLIDDEDEFTSDLEDDTLESDIELTKLADQQSNFEAQINNLVLNDLLNDVADLKTALENNTVLDKHSREYYEIKVPLQYYGETLLKIQKNITPLVNQDEIKKQLDEIKSALQLLSNKIGSSDDTISTPNLVVDQSMGSLF